MASVVSQIIARCHAGTANYEAASNSANLGDVEMIRYARKMMR